jgi:hypothetical protein
LIDDIPDQKGSSALFPELFLDLYAGYEKQRSATYRVVMNDAVNETDDFAPAISCNNNFFVSDRPLDLSFSAELSELQPFVQ